VCSPWTFPLSQEARSSRENRQRGEKGLRWAIPENPTPERWRLVEELYHEARTRPSGARAAFLVEACRDDEALRREVESLLKEPVSVIGFLDTPARAAAHSASEVTPGDMTGHTLGGYLLQSLLGAGGMGEVYLARDPKLGRDVAIKILPRAVTSDPDRLARFDREARMLAALNHPNICAIYGLEEADGIRFLILERVDGATLAERIQRTGIAGLAIDEVLSIARQIVEALEAAHEKGIVHRDLKPANIKITTGGVVKVLDFGLAKPIADESAADLTKSPTVTIGGTRDGVILGTVAYMSPEQARGKAIDKRTDIWAFGCVLYEMLTGRVPFDGETVSDTIGRILEREPGWSALPNTTPTPIRRLLLRCFAKDPKQRLRDIGDVRIEIDAIDEVLPGTSDATDASRSPAKRRATWLPWMAFAALAASVGVWEARRPVTAPESPLANAQFTRLTNWEGTEEGAEISPDGKFVAFLADHDGEFDIWLSQVGTGRFSNLTRDIPPLSASGSIVRKLGFSGDGTDIWFNPADAKPLMFMPLTGGTPRAFLGKGANVPAWSPDGTHLVYVYKPDQDDPIYLADRTGADARQILAPGVQKNNNPVWSPDGQWIYFVRGLEPQDEVDMDVWRLRPSGGSPERLTEQHTAINFLAPLDTRTLLYVARAEDWSGPWLWTLDVESKVTRRVLSSVDQYTSVAASRDGRRLVATVANPSASLWRVPLLDRLADDRDAQPYQLPAPTGRALAPRFGGTTLYYLSARGTGDGLWKVQDGQASEVWSSVDRSLSEPPAVSPDGGRLVVVVRQNGKRHLSMMSADGTNSRTLAPSIDIEGAAGQGTADWSPDGKWIVTGGSDAHGSALFKIPVDGGEPIRLVEGKFVNPVWSPSGDLIVYAGRSVVGQVTLLGVRPDGAPVELPHVLARPGGYRFLPNGRGLVYVPRIPSLDFWLLDFATKTPRPLTQLSNQGALRTFDITPDGKNIVFDRSRQNSNIVLIELAK
jgi:serine/threonine protein kinase/Tol biopolymer transport system component